MSESYQPLVIFDGFCNLCDSTVQFIIKEDKKQVFKFASFQSKFAQPIILKYDLKDIADKSVILIAQSKAYTRSAAILKIIRYFGGYYRIFAGILFVIPSPLRNVIYNIISKNRYKWFGKNDVCLLPTPEIMERFLS